MAHPLEPEARTRYDSATSGNTFHSTTIGQQTGAADPIATAFLGFYESLRADQQELEPEAHALLRKNLWSLYE